MIQATHNGIETLANGAIDDAVKRIIQWAHSSGTYDESLRPLLTEFPEIEMQYPLISQLFIEHYLRVVKTKTLLELRKRLQSSSPSTIEGSCSAILWLWDNVAYPQKLVSSDIWQEDYIIPVSVAFSTVVRYVLDMKWFVRELGRSVDKNILIRLSEAGFIEEVNSVLALYVSTRINQYISDHWSKRYSPDTVDKVEAWIENDLSADVLEVLSKQPDPTGLVPIAQMRQIAHASLAELRIQELYDIVAQGNRDGLQDLQLTVTSPELRDNLVRSFYQQCECRLLNGGSDTVDIIQMYLKANLAFSTLDPQGVLFAKLSRPIRATLKERPDTSVRLAEGLFGVDISPLKFLAGELKKQSEPKAKTNISESYSDWIPDPVDTPADFVRRQTTDVVSTLINLYDNKEVFAKQFAELYSSALLNAPFGKQSGEEDILTRLEEHYQFLAAVFGESHLHRIRVMLADIRQSHQSAEAVHHSNYDLSRVSALVLSRLYWPSLQRQPDLIRGRSYLDAVPAYFRKSMEQYAEQFKDIPGNEMLDLRWLPNHGRVCLSLELADRTLELAVHPDQAVLISAFSDVGSSMLSLSDLSEVTNLDEAVLLESIQFWVDRKVLGTDGEKYKVLETQEEADSQAHTHTQVITAGALAGGSGNGAGKQSKEAFEDMRIYWSYIVGMLTNLGALPTDKIHSFLVMFVPSDDPYVKTKQELENYLLWMVDEEKLKFEDGKFSLVKS